MNDLSPDCPAIHVTFTALADDGLWHWVRVGAEEEGVPCRRQPARDPVDVVALAYAAAEGSRLNIGLAVDRSLVVLHEAHMPPRQPVLQFRFDEQAPAICRLMGSNAARMVMRLPFRFPGEEQPAAREEVRQQQPAQKSNPVPPAAAPGKLTAAAPDVDPQQIAAVVAAIVRNLEARGIEL